MPTVTPEDLDYTVDEIRDKFAGRGFTAETCGSCKATANVLAGNPGWFCPCGHFNTQSWNHHQIPHDEPTYGPPHDRIVEAFKDVELP